MQTEMIKSSQTSTNLPDLQKAVNTFRTEMLKAYSLCKNTTVPNDQSLFLSFKRYLEEMGRSPVLPDTFTTDQLRSSLRAIEFFSKALASFNVFQVPEIKIKFEHSPYYTSLLGYGKQVQKQFYPLAATIKSNATDAELIESAPKLTDAINKIGYNFLYHLNEYLELLKSGHVVKAEENLSSLIQLIGQFNHLSQI